MKEKVIFMLWTIIVIIFILWLLGAFGGRVFSGFPKVGSWIHVLVVIAVILLILKLVGAI
ncbi:MAG: lmo0937 family membrane protein [Clostridia bacterium]